MKSKLTLLLLFVFIGILGKAQFHPDSLIHFEIQGNDTDPLIILDGQKKHQVFINTTAPSKNTLLLHLVGSIDNPNSTILYPTIAANSGFHCINLAYRNGTSGQSACGMIPDTSCHLKWRKEIIEGIDYSSEINVNYSNSIYNRLLKLLSHLDALYPSHGWDQFYSGNTIIWDNLIVSGHSQGGAHAAVIGMMHSVKRVLMFASPNDYIDTLQIAAPWTSYPHMVADSNYYGFNALFDEVVDYWKQFEHSSALGLDNHGDTTNIDQVASPFNMSRQLYTRQEVPAGSPFQLTHDIVVRDFETPVDLNGQPEFACVWKYMLGDECIISSAYGLDHHVDVAIYPNPAHEIITIIIPTGLNINQIQIIDINGRVINNQFIGQSTRFNMSLVGLSAGIYFLRTVSETGLNSYKFIKE